MDYFSFLRELKEGKPDRRKAAKALKILGWVAIAGGVWNFVLPLVFQANPAYVKGIPIPESYPYLALAVFAYPGAMLLLAANGIKWGRPWGAGLGRFAVVALYLSFFGLMAFAIQDALGEASDSFRLVGFLIMLGIGGWQFGVPVYRGVKYLGRLPLPSGEELYRGESLSGTRSVASVGRGSAEPFGSPEALYKSSPSPFGFFVTGLLFVFVLLSVMFGAIAFAKGMAFAFVFPVWIGVFLGAVAFNYSRSPFEKGRTALTRYTGGGSILFFNGSWPFFRLIVYRDAVEVRGFFHRFLVPYDKMGALPDKLGFFNRGIEINSELPGVPSTIRYFGFSNRRILETIREARSLYLLEKRGS